MVIATVAGGVFMYAVHKVASKMPKAEYGVFLTLLQVYNQMLIPSLGLMTIFAQQSVVAFTDAQRRQLTAAVRAVALAGFFLWLIIAALAFVFRADLLTLWKISNPAALWVTLVIGLLSIWVPIAMGILQGQQNFLWLGWTAIFNGMGRFVAISIIVLLLGGWAAGAMTGALIGAVIALAVGLWHTRRVWLGPSTRFEWRPWLGRVLPLTLGLGASQFMMSADQIVVQSIFDKEITGYYGAAGMIGRALVAFTAP
jgi:O-antigen/teichoic acid export membrane protein